MRRYYFHLSRIAENADGTAFHVYAITARLCEGRWNFRMTAGSVAMAIVDFKRNVYNFNELETQPSFEPEAELQ